MEFYSLDPSFALSPCLIFPTLHPLPIPPLPLLPPFSIPPPAILVPLDPSLWF